MVDLMSMTLEAALVQLFFQVANGRVDLPHRVAAVAVINRIGPAEQVYTEPKDEYTKALLSAVPIPDPRAMKERKVERRKHRHALAEA